MVTDPFWQERLVLIPVIGCARFEICDIYISKTAMVFSL